MRRFWLNLGLWVLVLLLGANVSAQTTSKKLLLQWVVNRAKAMLSAPAPAAPQQGFVLQLQPWQLVPLLQPLDAEARVEVVRQIWPDAKGEGARASLLQAITNMDVVSGAPCNPHLLEILHLGATDPAQGVRQEAFRTLTGIAFKEIFDKDGYLAWRQQIGDRPLETIVRENARTMAQG